MFNRSLKNKVLVNVNFKIKEDSIKQIKPKVFRIQHVWIWLNKPSYLNRPIIKDYRVNSPH